MLLSLPEHSNSGVMAFVDPIDISSTDSDSDLREIDNYRDESPVRDSASSISSRVLPSWASSSHPDYTGNNGLSLKDPSPSKRQIDETSTRPYKRPNTGKTVGNSSSLVDGKNGSREHVKLGMITQRHSSHQSTNRALPSSFQPSTSGVKLNNFVENAGVHEIREPHGKSYQSAAWSNSTTAKNPMKENYISGSGNDSLLHEKRGIRLLPPSLIPGKHTQADTLVGSNDPFLHTGAGEERQAGPDERFVFQAAVQDLHQPKTEAKLPGGLLSVSLLRHQKIALAWMLNKESSGLCLGGILADDQGLGKTVSMIALIQMQRILEAKSKPKDSCDITTEALNLDDDDGNNGCIALDGAKQPQESNDLKVLPKASNTVKGFQSRRPTAGTLIVCPASVLRQWARELEEKVTDEARLSVLIYHGGSRTKNPASLAKFDAVLTTYAIVTNEVPKRPLVEEDNDEQKDGDRYGLSSAFSMEKKGKKPSANKKSKKGKKEMDVSAFDGNCGTLAKVKWSRVVLDESQMIKNHRTLVARACCSLRAKRRWCLSGTPIQNSVEELFSYFRFLRYDPYDKYKTFSSSIKALISRDSVKGYKKLQIVLRNIMLRRTKGTLIDGEPIITLPPKKIHLMKVEFSSEERAFYEQLEADSRKQFKVLATISSFVIELEIRIGGGQPEYFFCIPLLNLQLWDQRQEMLQAYAAAGTLNQNYANILLMLLRLRQACDHPLLVKGLGSDPLGNISRDMARTLPGDLVVNLLKSLETSSAICLVCTDPPENAVVTMCGHVFCYQCVSDYLTGEDNTCPAPECKEQLGADVVYSSSTLRGCISDGYDGDNPVPYGLVDKSKVGRRDYVSSKIKAVLEILKAHCILKNASSQRHDLVRYGGDTSSSGGLCLHSESREREKAIVFSQWTSMLDLLEMSFKNFCINFRRLDGTMSIAARDKAVKEFNTEPEVDVMLMSLKAGNLGLNMVAACRVILLDLWWNPTTEDQAIDRAHRIGQTRPVTVSRLTIKDTVEDRILSLQEDKRKMVASAFGEDQSGNHATRLTIDDLRFLFEGSGR